MINLSFLLLHAFVTGKLMLEFPFIFILTLRCTLDLSYKVCYVEIIVCKNWCVTFNTLTMLNQIHNFPNYITYQVACTNSHRLYVNIAFFY